MNVPARFSASAAIPLSRFVCSASGVPLEGDRLVRVVYMDESGLSKREPILVEAAIIVVLACFDPYWPVLKSTVAGFEFTPLLLDSALRGYHTLSGTRFAWTAAFSAGRY